MIKDLIVKALTESSIKDYIKQNNTCPSYMDMHVSAINKLNKAFSISEIPSFGFRSNSSATELNSSLTNVKNLFKSISNSADDIVAEHQHISDSYIDISTRIDNELLAFKGAINELLNYSCYDVSTRLSNQSINSNAGTIGSYITMPFFINNAEMYNGRTFISVITDGEVQFSNFNETSIIPLSDLPSAKISSAQNKITSTISISIEETTSNLVYIKLLNDVVSVKLTLSGSGQQVYTSEYSTNEILANFSPCSFDSIELKVIQLNPNTDKPISLQIGSIEIFKEIVFAKNGIFESLPIDIGELAGNSSIKVGFNNLSSDILNTNVKQYVSLDNSYDETNSIGFSQINKDEKVDISLYRFRYARNINPGSGTVSFNTKKSSSSEIESKEFYKYDIGSPSGSGDPNYNLWNMNYKRAYIFYGLNRDYLNLSGGSFNDYRFENWTLVKNYYTSYIINFEDNVIVDLGSKSAIINGVEQTGKFTFPMGISIIQVHTKDMVLPPEDGILHPSEIKKKQNMYPYNLLYSFAGMPEYNEGTDSLADKRTKGYSVKATTTLDLGDAFIPMTETVTDSNGLTYTMHLNEYTNVPGTYSIMPNGGKINVCPYQPGSGINITVTYNRAMPNKKPCGVLFNRLLTFAPIDSLVSSGFGENLLFGFDGNPTQRFIYMPIIPQVSINNIQVLFNLESEELYSAVRIVMESSDKYLTPLISTVSLTVQ